ncbi:MAG TPA: patatin-like protein [Acidimicrobiia bacterium]
MSREPVDTRPSDDVRELRLALVCYGGVSLAIYMHGVTKEIHKLVRASAAFEHDPTHNPFADHETERVYWDVLARMQTGELGTNPAGVRTRVVVDIVSGTSAGGINGICLAKGLAENRSQDQLKALWLDKGDIAKLLRGPSWLPPGLRFAWFVVRSINRPLAVAPPLRGDEMCRWLHDALAAMDTDAPTLPQVETLVPDDHRLDLFVPITDFRGFNREIPIADPKFVHDISHRYVLQFTYEREGHNQLGGDFNHVLAFAARATSSFPGAFPPISVDDYDKLFPDGTNLRQLLPQFFSLYELAGEDAGERYFVDGGVLDNFPFASAIDAIKGKPSSYEVVRRLLFIEPDPSPHAESNGRRQKPGVPAAQPPSWHATMWGAFAGIPRDEPIVDDLARLAVRNEVVDRVRDIIEASFETIRDRVRDLVVHDLGSLPTRVSFEQLAAWHSLIEARASEAAGFSFATYVRLRIHTVIDNYATAIANARRFPPGSYHALFVTSVLRSWAETSGLWTQNVAATDAQTDFLAAFDLDYRDRRLRFLIAGLSWWYADSDKPGFPSRDELDQAKATLYAQLGGLYDITDDLASDPSTSALLATLFDEDKLRTWVLERHASPAEFVTAHRDQLDALRQAIRYQVAARLPTLEQDLYRNIVEFTAPWSDEVRGDLIVRELGFPFWDILVYPIEAISDVGERDRVDVLRMSPIDSTLLSRPGEQKLKGVSLHHFGAFFNRSHRENDYLWGRLDSAERLLTLLLDHPDTPAIETPNLAVCRRAFAAILADERDALEHSKSLLDDLGQRVNDLAASQGWAKDGASASSKASSST